MRWLAALFILSALAGCAGGDSDDPTQAAPPTRPPPLPTEDWKALLSQPIYSGAISRNVALTAADGAHLSLTVHLPDGLPADAKVPTILEITPYQAFLATNWDVPPFFEVAGPGSSWRDLVVRGAAYVEADARGTTASDGCLDFGGSLDRSDARDFIAWIRAQPWSNGIVVTDGVSHPGMGSVVAHAAEPTLDGALTHAPVVSYYRDEWYQGAKFEDQINGPAYQAVELSPTVRSDPDAMTAQAATCTGQTTLDFNAPDGRHGALWADRDLSRHIDPAVQAPILLTQGFVDQNVHPDHAQLYWDALPDDFPKYVIWGWWYHGWPDFDGHPAAAFADWRLRWLDTTLFGIDNGLWREDRVLVEDSQGTWHTSHTWPLAPGEDVTWWTGDDGLLAAPPSDTTSSYTDRLGAARGTWTDAHVAFRSEPLGAARLVNGAPMLHLVASSEATATKWVVYLMDEAPDGSWQRISHGYADSHTYPGEDAWADLTPGKAEAWDIMLMPTAVVVEEGHRITLVVASQDSRQVTNALDLAGFDQPCFSDHRGGCYNPRGILPAPESLGRVNTVHGGPEGTTLRFSWVDPALTAKP